jgi:transcriptional regulator with XRE-family HTH domain
MTYRELSNYLRTYRKRTGLSQRDVAFLLGGHDAARVSRYEHFNGSPSLRVSLAFAAIFQATVRELFRGEYQKVEEVVHSRARILAARLATYKQDQLVDRKLTVLKNILSIPSTDQIK